MKSSGIFRKLPAFNSFRVALSSIMPKVFKTVFIRARCLFLSWDWRLQSTPSKPIYLSTILIVSPTCTKVYSRDFPSDFPSKICYVFFSLWKVSFLNTKCENTVSNSQIELHLPWGPPLYRGVSFLNKKCENTVLNSQILLQLLWGPPLYRGVSFLNKKCENTVLNSQILLHLPWGPRLYRGEEIWAPLIPGELFWWDSMLLVGQPLSNS
jgi:hypothetical protein